MALRAAGWLIEAMGKGTTYSAAITVAKNQSAEPATSMDDLRAAEVSELNALYALPSFSKEPEA